MTASYDTAIGYDALSNDTTGGFNVGIGSFALVANQDGTSNVAIGHLASYNNTSASSNIAIGQAALYFNTTGGSNISIGAYSALNLVNGSNNIYIASGGGAPAESNAIRIGDSSIHQSAFIAGAYGVSVLGGLPLMIASGGQLGTLSSSRRYKDSVADIADGSAGLMRLRPVSFRYKNQPDSKEYGLIAEEVAEVYPEAVVYKDGQPEAVQYHKINALLLNEVQKQHAEIEMLKRQVSELKALASAGHRN